MNPPPIRILRRPVSQVIPQTVDNAQSTAPIKTLEQREADYAAARRRIMGSESEDPSVAENSGVSASEMTSESGSESKTTTQPDDQGKKTPMTLIKSSYTAIPLMSIPTAALSIPSSLDRNPSITTRSMSSANLTTQQTISSTPFSSCDASSTHQLPQPSSTTFASDSLLQGYPSMPHMFHKFNNSTMMPQPSQNPVVDVMQQVQSGQPNELKSGVPLNIAHQFYMFRQYQQSLAAGANQVNTHPYSNPATTMQPSYQRTTAVCNQMHNLMPSMQFRTAPPRFAHSSGYN